VAATAGLAASIVAPAGSPYVRDSSEKDHAMVGRAGSDGAVRLEEGVIGMLRKLSRKARGVHHGPF